MTIIVTPKPDGFAAHFDREGVSVHGPTRADVVGQLVTLYGGEKGVYVVDAPADEPTPEVSIDSTEAAGE